MCIRLFVKQVWAEQRSSLAIEHPWQAIVPQAMPTVRWEVSQASYILRQHSPHMQHF